MNNILTTKWPRVVLCGLVTGVAFTLMSIVLISALGNDFLATVAHNAPVGAGAPKTGPVLYLLTVAAGIWAMWLYSIVRPGCASNIKAGAVVGIAWWVIASLQSWKLVALLGIPATAWLPLSFNAVLCLVAAMLGGSLYGAAQPKKEARAEDR